MTHKPCSIGSILAHRAAAQSAREAALAVRDRLRQLRIAEAAAERALLEEIQDWYQGVVERQARVDRDAEDEGARGAPAAPPPVEQSARHAQLAAAELARRRQEDEQWVTAYLDHRLRVADRARRREIEDARWKAEDALFEVSGRVVTVGRDRLE